MTCEGFGAKPAWCGAIGAGLLALSPPRRLLSGLDKTGLTSDA
jgi:hypothetical protein